MIKFYLIYISLLISLMTGISALAQVHSGVNLYTQNLFTHNPSFASSSEKLKAAVQTTKVVGEQGNNLSVSRFNIQGKLQDSFGIGARVSLYNQGEYNSLLADIVSSYKIRLDENQSLQTGLSLGIVNNSTNIQRFMLNDFANHEDPILRAGDSRSIELTVGAGFNYVFKKAQLAVSFPALSPGLGGFFNHYHAIVSYQFDSVGQLPLQFKPLITLSKFPFSPAYMDFNLQMTWNNRCWIQPGIRSTGAFMTALGLKINELNIGYAFGIPYKKEGLMDRSLHEIILSFQFR